MIGNFTALALALVIMATVASITVCIFAFEIFSLVRERAIRSAANSDGGNGVLQAVSPSKAECSRYFF
jgi:hypothetical protein